MLTTALLAASILIGQADEPMTLQMPGRDFEHLEELEYSIGTWESQASAEVAFQIEENGKILTEAKKGEEFTVRLTFEWTSNKCAMVMRGTGILRGKTIPASSLRVYAWDPEKKQIVFLNTSPSGGIARGVATKDRHVFRSLLPDGKVKEFVQLTKRLDANTFTVQNTEVVEDGQSKPDEPLSTYRRLSKVSSE